MMPASRPLRLVAVMTHPVQYMAPWFRYIHANVPELSLTVVYATEPTPEQQGVGFGHPFAWDAPLRDGYSSVVVTPRAGGSVASDRFFGLHVPEVPRVVRDLRPDVALVTGWHSATQVRAIATLRRAGVPLLYRGDSHLGSRRAGWTWLSRARARLMLRQFSGYLAVGERSREYLRAMGAPDPAIVWSPHAVDNDAFAARARAARGRRADIRASYGVSETEAIVLFAGKLTAVKRPQAVLDAVAHMRNAVALFVGDGDERGALAEHARSRGIRCVHAGFANQRQMTDAYVAADVLFVPGRETWGLVANEALASGTPVLMTTEAGAAPDLVSDGTCMVVAPHDPRAAAAALESLIEHRRRGDGSAEACERAVSRHSFRHAADGLVTAARFAFGNAQAPAADANARVVALAGNLVFAGGMERITFEGLAALRRGGGDVHVLLNGWGSRSIAQLAERDHLTWSVGYYDTPLHDVFRRPARMLRVLGAIARVSLHLLATVRRRRATHVFAVDFRAVLLHAPALAVCRLLGVPVVLRSGVPPTRTALHAALWRHMIGRLVSRHIANSVYTAREIEAVGVARDRIVTIPNVAPRRTTTAIPVPRQAGRVAYVGQVIPEKGVYELVDAIAVLAARGYDVSLDVAGQMDGWAPPHVLEYRSALRARAQQADLHQRVRFVGWREDIAPVLHAADVHCCPSQPQQREGFGLTVVEAKQAGVPSVVCPSGALPELIQHQHDGVIAAGFDATAIADGLEWLLADRSRLEALRHAARASAARFSLAEFEQRWQEEFGVRQAPPVTAAPALSRAGGTAG